ncbi:MAG: UbiD family decarboxylase [Syntrophorhabdaceae bacterium]|nr:UbiD family decarboxylase [Syntrophorhabdaceae bacterium]
MKDLRAFISEVEEKLPREFVRVTKEVDPKYEISAIIKKLDLMGKSPLVFFENVKGYPFPVVCNTETTATKFGLALNCPPEKIEDFYAEREEEAIRLNRFPAKEIDRKDASCKEVIKTGKKANMFDFPFLTHHTGEAPYLTRAIGVVMDKNIGKPHCAHYRFMVKEPRLGVTHITPGRHFWNIYNHAMEENKPLEIAFVLGLHPAWALASQSRVSHPPSEFDIAGSLIGEPLELVRCETIDVLVPAHAEIVIEGEIPPHTRELEGPWCDFTRYHQVAERHPVRIKAITYRKKAIVHDMGAWPTRGGMLLGRIPQHAFMNRKIKELVPDVKKFRFIAATGWFYGFIQLDKKHVAQPKQAILAAFANDIYLKYVVCFDTDIDIEDGRQMAWALATRVQADRDIMILPGVLGTDLDLSAPAEGVVTKVGIDATAKPFRKDMPPVVSVPEDVMASIDLKKYIKNLNRLI